MKNENTTNAPTTSDADMQAAIQLDRADADMDIQETRKLLATRATWLGKLAPNASNAIDDGEYKYVVGYTTGEAVAEMYDWLVCATLTTTDLNVPGQSKPEWVIGALEKIADSKTLRQKINELRLELADAAEARISGIEKEDLLAAIFGKTEAKTEEEIYAELTAARSEFEALPGWAQRASYKND